MDIVGAVLEIAKCNSCHPFASGLNDWSCDSDGKRTLFALRRNRYPGAFYERAGDLHLRSNAGIQPSREVAAV